MRDETAKYGGMNELQIDYSGQGCNRTGELPFGINAA
jgi:hypothetical protein